MINILKYLFNGLMIFFGLLVAVVSYALFWETAQPEIKIKKAKLRLIKPYRMVNDLHWNINGYRVYIYGESMPIDFSSDNWCTHRVCEGDRVNLAIRRSFPWFGLKDEYDGLVIEKINLGGTIILPKNWTVV